MLNTPSCLIVHHHFYLTNKTGLFFFFSWWKKKPQSEQKQTERQAILLGNPHPEKKKKKRKIKSQISVREGCWLSEACAAAEWSSLRPRARAWAWRFFSFPLFFFFFLFSILHSFPCSALPHSLGFSIQIQKTNKIETPSPYVIWSLTISFFFFFSFSCDGQESFCAHRAE